MSTLLKMAFFLWAMKQWFLRTAHPKTCAQRSNHYVERNRKDSRQFHKEGSPNVSDDENCFLSEKDIEHAFGDPIWNITDSVKISNSPGCSATHH